jgi:hypothetical protein
MAHLYHTFGDIEGKLDVLCVECTKCERKKLRFGSWLRENDSAGGSDARLIQAERRP